MGARGGRREQVLALMYTVVNGRHSTQRRSESVLDDPLFRA